jgi:cytochrome c oxidase cbb3-type subunit 2
MNHELIEKNVSLLIIAILVVISFGSLTEIVPLLFIDETNEPVEGLQPLGAVELEGRDIYIREGCHVCHTQMIRPLKTEVERYGSHSLAGEFIYDHPYLWGSKRTGPDLARVGGRYSDDWHLIHLKDPRQVVPESNMPAFPWLFDRILDGASTGKKMAALRRGGVPYTDKDIQEAQETVAGTREVDALVQYLQQLGTLRPNKR